MTSEYAIPTFCILIVSICVHLRKSAAKFVFASSELLQLFRRLNLRV